MKVLKDSIIKTVPKVCKNASTHSPGSKSYGRKRLYLCTMCKRKMRANRLLPSFPYMKIELIFNHPAEVTAVRYFKSARTSYAICPSCGYSFEREYQKHCDQCGQLLAWNRFTRNKINVVEISP